MTVNELRRRNLARLLRCLHERGPQSRAALTETLGVNRSTVGALVGELAELGLAVEAPPAANGVGRPSPVVAVAPGVAAIAANPEVDALTIAAVRLDRSIVARARIPAAARYDPATVAARIAECIATWRAGPLRAARLAGVGLAIPGFVRARDGLVRDAPHLGWRDERFAQRVEAATGLACRVGNDASLGALAEHGFGAARGVDDALYLNGGASGIGGGLVLGGRLIGGADGYAGEFGHVRGVTADAADRLVPDGVLEDEINRARLVRAAGLGEADDDALNDALTVEPAGAAAALASEAARQRRLLVAFLADLATALNPAVIVLGGFLVPLGGDEATLTGEVRRVGMRVSAERVRVRHAALGADRLLVGAAELAFEPLLADPSG